MRGVWRAIQIVLVADHKLVPIPLKRSILSSLLPFLSNMICSSGGLGRYHLEDMRRALEVACFAYSSQVCQEALRALGASRLPDNACELFLRAIRYGSSLPPRLHVEWLGLVAAAATAVLSRAQDFADILHPPEEVTAEEG